MKNTLRQPQGNCFLVVFAKAGSGGVTVKELAGWEIYDLADRYAEAEYDDFDDACSIAFKDGSYWLFEKTEDLIAFEKSCTAHNASDIRIAIDNFLENWL